MQWYEVQLMGCVTSIFYVYCTAPPPYPTTYDKPMALLGHQLDVVLLLNKEA